ncbi:RIP metalloprotease [uncultured Demequina sp.]|uniref:M50 family metallopeptidase n=1 Tax=uncultured Demequina sp. TaxID=693499 RepID=UPI0025FBEA91|nr:site-2 protease family protein [uncultured Demequina sp.]
MATAVGILVLVIGLLISIALHELGHMIPAKKFGVRVSEYFVGFGPRVWSRVKGETEYGLKAIPLGGYVRLVGMIPPEERVKPVRGTGWASRLIGDAREAAVEEIQPGEDHRAFYHLTWWRKIIVMMGGPLVNLVLAVVLFTGVLSIVGTPTQSLTVGAVVPCTPAAGATTCTEDDPASPAVAAGLQDGDVIVAVDDVPAESWAQATAIIADSPGQSLPLEVERDGEIVALTVTPAERDRAVYDDEGEVVLDAAGEPVLETVGYLGVYSELVNERQPLTAGSALTWEYLVATTDVIVHLPSHLIDAAQAALGQEERRTDSVMGVVGVGRVAGEIAGTEVEGYSITERVADMLMLLGGLNLALFVFNMIPLVPLDGGHVASALWQGIKNGWARLRRLPAPAPVDVARMMPLAYGVFGILLVMGVVLIYADIVAPVSVL